MSTRATARARAAEPATAPRPRTRPAPAPAPRSRRAAPAPARRPRTAPVAARLRSAWIVIPLIAVILGGIVFVNVAKLSLTNRTTQVIQRSRSIESETARLKATLDAKDAAVRASAQERLGMVEPALGEARYLDPRPVTP